MPNYPINLSNKQVDQLQDLELMSHMSKIEEQRHHTVQDSNKEKLQEVTSIILVNQLPIPINQARPLLKSKEPNGASDLRLEVEST